ncbi:hypothetical protein LR007_01650 [candidate division NPL-UPA2 bacterium]|nr:hypothetical protein [candidate division NPL-UPA2 bacterium]
MTHLYDQIKSIAETKYKDIVTSTKTLGKRTVGSSKLRLFIKDGSFLDIWLSGTGKYSFH